MWKPFLVGLVIAAFLLGDRATPQESKKEQYAKPLAGYSVLIVEKFKVEPAAVKAGFVEAQVPVMQARERNFARRSGHTARYGAGASWAFVFCDHPRRLLALDPGGCSGRRAKSRGFSYATQVDSSCRI
jgi:hypothetical protein